MVTDDRIWRARGWRTQGPASLLALTVALWIIAAPLLPEAGAASGAARANPVAIRLEPAQDALDGPPLVPGGSRYRALVVGNDGPRAVRYRLDLVMPAADPLADALGFEARVVPGACDEAAFFATSERLGGPLPLSQVRALGDRVLAPGAEERLCVRVWLPETAPAELAGVTAEGVVRVTAVER